MRTAAAVKEGLNGLRQHLAARSLITRYHQWPSLSHFENGIPNISMSRFNQPPDYSGAFRRGEQGEWYVSIEKISAFDELQRFVRGRPDILHKIIWPAPELTNAPVDFGEFQIDRFALRLLGRYTHLYGAEPFDESRLLPLYRELERGVLNDELPVDVLVPILFLRFNTDEYDLGNGASIVRLSDDMQLARADIGGAWDNNVVRGAATHALRVPGHTIRNRSNLLGQATAYPIDKINLFLAALRIITGVETGYAQLLAVPQGWAHGWRAWLPAMEGTSCRAYPPDFDDYRWLRAVETVEPEALSEIAIVFAALETVRENKIRIAVKRLNRCYARDDEEDTVLDAVVGLEALLADDAREGIAHRLALRLGALATVSPRSDLSPKEVFESVKRIYDYRSRLVHGGDKAQSRREIELPGGRREPAASLAVRYLRRAIQILLQYPEYRDAKAIDMRLLGGLDE